MLINRLSVVALAALALSTTALPAAAQSRANNSGPMVLVPGIQQMLGHKLDCVTYDIGRGALRLVVRNVGTTTVPGGTELHWYLQFANFHPLPSMGNVITPAALPPGGNMLFENEAVNTQNTTAFTCVVKVV
jgi:hypothetical protein